MSIFTTDIGSLVSVGGCPNESTLFDSLAVITVPAATVVYIERFEIGNRVRGRKGFSGCFINKRSTIHFGVLCGTGYYDDPNKARTVDRGYRLAKAMRNVNWT